MVTVAPPPIERLERLPSLLLVVILREDKTTSLSGLGGGWRAVGELEHPAIGEVGFFATGGGDLKVGDFFSSSSTSVSTVWLCFNLNNELDESSSLSLFSSLSWSGLLDLGERGRCDGSEPALLSSLTTREGDVGFGFVSGGGDFDNCFSIVFFVSEGGDFGNCSSHVFFVNTGTGDFLVSTFPVILSTGETPLPPFFECSFSGACLETSLVVVGTMGVWVEVKLPSLVFSVFVCVGESVFFVFRSLASPSSNDLRAADNRPLVAVVLGAGVFLFSTLFFSLRKPVSKDFPVVDLNRSCLAVGGDDTCFSLPPPPPNFAILSLMELLAVLGVPGLEPVSDSGFLIPFRVLT